MSDLNFRNVDVSPSDPVEVWPYEALVIAMERGYLADWSRIAHSSKLAPWGKTARAVEAYAEYGEHDIAALLTETIRIARISACAAAADAVAGQVRSAVARSGLTAGEFALEVGTSGSRMSTYMAGKVAPSAPLLQRIVWTADRLQKAAGESGSTSRS